MYSPLDQRMRKRRASCRKFKSTKKQKSIPFIDSNGTQVLADLVHSGMKSLLGLIADYLGLYQVSEVVVDLAQLVRPNDFGVWDIASTETNQLIVAGYLMHKEGREECVWPLDADYTFLPPLIPYQPAPSIAITRSHIYCMGQDGYRRRFMTYDRKGTLIATDATFDKWEIRTHQNALYMLNQKKGEMHILESDVLEPSEKDWRNLILHLPSRCSRSFAVYGSEIFILSEDGKDVFVVCSPDGTYKHHWPLPVEDRDPQRAPNYSIWNNEGRLVVTETDIVVLRDKLTVLNRVYGEFRGSIDVKGTQILAHLGNVLCRSGTELRMCNRLPVA